jgi:ABC-2 type transport system ATP-binding protein
MPFIDVRGLTRQFGRFAAISDVSFGITQGEVLGLVGPNGAGKTTLLECMAGTMPATSGAVFHNDKPLSSRDRASLLFYLPEAIAPWPAQTVSWALDYAIGFFGGRPADRGAVIDALQLQPLLRSRMGTLSKGQRRRASLAVALLTPQPLLIADEPFEGLDLRQTREVAAVLRAHAAAGRTLLLSIHEIPHAARVCDRLVLLSGGRVRGEGTVEQLSALAATTAGAPAPMDLEEVVLALT